MPRRSKKELLGRPRRFPRWRNCSRVARSGITLVEVVISTMLVAIVMVTALQTLASTGVSRAASAARFRGPELAGLLMSEIMACRYMDPDGSIRIGAEFGETRATFDDVDDYHGLVESPPVGRLGHPVDGVAGWQREVQVTFCEPNTLHTSVTDTGLKHIRVSVLSPAGHSFTLESMLSKHGVLQTSVSRERIVSGRLQIVATDSTGSAVSAAAILPAFSDAP